MEEAGRRNGELGGSRMRGVGVMRMDERRHGRDERAKLVEPPAWWRTEVAVGLVKLLADGGAMERRRWRSRTGDCARVRPCVP